MKRAALALLVVPLVALWLYGCDKAENPLETQSQVSDTPLFAPGGGKVKAEPNPIGCTQDQVAKWDEAAAEWVCAEDLVGSAGGGPTVYYARATTDNSQNVTWTGDLPSGSSVTKSAVDGEWWIDFPSSVEACVIVAQGETDDGYNRATFAGVERSGAGRVYFAVYEFIGSSSGFNGSNGPLGVTLTCPSPVS